MNCNNNLTMWTVFTVALIPLLAIFVAWLQHRRTVYHSIVEFLSQGNTDDEKNRRKDVYKEFEESDCKLTGDGITRLEVKGNLGKIVSFYDCWAIMVKRNYLPLKTFRGINGITAVRMFFILLPYIQQRREQDAYININENIKICIPAKSYAADFEYLVKKILQKNLIDVDRKTQKQLLSLLLLISANKG